MVYPNNVHGRHVEDYQAALDYIRGHSLAGQVDPTRVALWGTSFAGGHVLKVAAADENSRIPDAESIRAVISQVMRSDEITPPRELVLWSGYVIVFPWIDIVFGSSNINTAFERIEG